MKIHRRSAWSEQGISDFLTAQRTPLRLACSGGEPFPTICSLWFLYENGAFWAASHKNAHIIKQLKADPHVGLEVATNDYPYRGVRGRGTVELSTENAEDLLKRLIDRYLEDTNAKLAQWLLSRAEEEYVIKVTPESINAWDFSDRMKGS